MKAFARLLEAPTRLGAVIKRDVPRPGRGEVLIRNHATSLNFHDLVGIAGGIANTTYPRVPFSDNAGVVEAVGEGVHGIAVGDRVLAGFFPHWLSGAPDREAMAIVLGDQIDGALQSHFVAPASALARIPAHLDFLEASTLGCAGLTAWRALTAASPPILAGDTVLIQGTGGVSLFALALAKQMGARIVVTSSSDAKLERARDLGADVLINYKSRPDWAAAVLEATDGRGADVVIEVAGGSTLSQSIAACCFGGRISLIGVLTGFDASEFPLAQVMIANQTIAGITVGNIAELRALCRAVEQSELRPVVDRTFSIDKVEEAIALMESQSHMGKIVIDLSGDKA